MTEELESYKITTVAKYGESIAIDEASFEDTALTQVGPGRLEGIQPNMSGVVMVNGWATAGSNLTQHSNMTVDSIGQMMNLYDKKVEADGSNPEFGEGLSFYEDDMEDLLEMWVHQGTPYSDFIAVKSSYVWSPTSRAPGKRGGAIVSPQFIRLPAKITDKTGEVAVTINNDGSVIIEKGANVNEAAMVFWSAVSKLDPEVIFDNNELMWNGIIDLINSCEACEDKSCNMCKSLSAMLLKIEGTVEVKTTPYIINGARAIEYINIGG